MTVTFRSPEGSKPADLFRVFVSIAINRNEKNRIALNQKIDFRMRHNAEKPADVLRYRNLTFGRDLHGVIPIPVIPLFSSLFGLVATGIAKPKNSGFL